MQPQLLQCQCCEMQLFVLHTNFRYKHIRGLLVEDIRTRAGTANSFEEISFDDKNEKAPFFITASFVRNSTSHPRAEIIRHILMSKCYLIMIFLESVKFLLIYNS